MVFFRNSYSSRNSPGPRNVKLSVMLFRISMLSILIALGEKMCDERHENLWPGRYVSDRVECNRNCYLSLELFFSRFFPVVMKTGNATSWNGYCNRRESSGTSEPSPATMKNTLIRAINRRQCFDSIRFHRSNLIYCGRFTTVGSAIDFYQIAILRKTFLSCANG